MNEGEKKRKKVKYRVRYDRIIMVLLAVIILMAVITSCVSGLRKHNKKGDVSQPEVSEETTQEIPQETLPAETLPVAISDDVTTTTSLELITTTTTTSTTFTTTDTSYETTETTTTTVTTKKEPLPKGYGEVAIDTEKIYSGNLLTVNFNNIYRFPTGDTEIVTLYEYMKTEYYGVSDLTVCLDKDVIGHLNDMMEDFAETQHNTDIVVIGGYRSAEDQNQRYYNGMSGVMGGFSDYHTGRSFDMGIFPHDGSGSGYYSPTGIYSWIDEHSAEYGFIVRYPEGKESFTNERARTQTYRYVGVPHAYYMKQNNLCLEEYIEKIKSYTINKPLEISAGTSLYKVYYVSAEDGISTGVGLPLGNEYEISGDNQEGFIVSEKVQ